MLILKAPLRNYIGLSNYNLQDRVEREGRERETNEDNDY